MLRTLEHIFGVVVVTVLAVACNASLDTDIMTADVPVILKLSIDVSDINSDKTTKAYADPVPPDELMQTLRIIIVREDGSIEHNRYIDLNSPTDYWTEENFEVLGNEEKTIYLIANEANTKVASAFDFSSLAVGATFPKEDMDKLTIDMSSDTDQMPLAIPMTSSHTVWMPQSDYSVELEIYRAATKFTYILINKTEFTLDLTEIGIGKAAQKEYFFPKDITIEYLPTEENPAIYDYEITGYSVPAGVGYYDFSKHYDSELLYGWGSLTLDPIYILEGKHTDGESGGLNYKTTLVLNGKEYTSYLPNLSALPRNTHAVITVTITENTLDSYDLNWIVDVRPYTEIHYGELELEPGFGL